MVRKMSLESSMNIFEASTVLVFIGSDVKGRSSRHPSAVFSCLETGERRIGKYKLTGLLTEYVLDVPAFERSLELGLVPEHQLSGDFRQVWAGGEVHYHAEDGVLMS